MRIFIIAVLFLVSNINYAQIQNDTIKLNRLLKELEINASLADKKTPISFTNIKKIEIDKINYGKDIPYVIENTPSIVSSSDAGTGIGYTNFRLRGSDQTRINVTINGIPINDSESQGVWWVNMPDLVSSVDEIQIQRGVGTSTNGASAFGGTINLKTNTINPLPYFNSKNTIGSFNTFKRSASFGTGNMNGFSFDGRISKVNSDGYIDRATADLESYYLSANYVGDDEIINIINFKGNEVTYQAWYGVPKNYLENDFLRTYNYYTYKNEIDNYTQDHYQLHYKKQLNNNRFFNFSAHHTLGEGYYEQEKLNESLSDYGLSDLYFGNDTVSTTNLVRRKWLDNDFTGAVYSFENSLDKAKFILGGSYNIYRGKHFGNVIWSQFTSDGSYPHIYYNNKSTKTDNNLYAKINYEFNQSVSMFVDVQSRNISYDFEGFDEDSTSLTNLNQKLNFLNPKIGINFDNNDKRTYLYFGKAEKEPSRNDYVDSEYNNYPKSEKLYNVELGHEIKNSASMISINGYFMYYEDQLVNTGKLNDVGAYIRTNVDESYRTGVEITGMSNFGNGFLFNGSLSISDNKITRYDEYVDNWDPPYEQTIVTHENVDLAFSPNIIYSSTFEKTFNNGIQIALNSKYVGEQFIDNTSSDERKLDDYFVNNLILSYNINFFNFSNSKITLMVNNIFDELYANNAWTYRYYSEGYDPRADDPYTNLNSDNSYSMNSYFPQAGRNYMLSLNIGL